MPVETWTVEPSATRDVVLVLDHFRPERHAVTQLYSKHFLGVVYIVDATGWPGCLKLRPAQACKLQYREFFPGDGHYRAVAETMGAIAVHLGLAPRRRAFKAAGWLKELNNLASALLQRPAAAMYGRSVDPPWTADRGTAVTPPCLFRRAQR